MGQVCKLLQNGGLGIRSVIAVNKVMLGKWLWWLGQNKQSMWCKLLIVKYHLYSNGWLVPTVDYGSSGLWWLKLSVKCDFDLRICFFWNDLWCDNALLKQQFLGLYQLDRKREVVVAEQFQVTGGKLIWNLNLRSDLRDEEVTDLTTLLSMPEKVFLTLESDNERLWSLDVKGELLIKSFYSSLQENHTSLIRWRRFWNKLIP